MGDGRVFGQDVLSPPKLLALFSNRHCDRIVSTQRRLMCSVIPIWLVLAAPLAWTQDDYAREPTLGIESFYDDRLQEAVVRWEHCLGLQP